MNLNDKYLDRLIKCAHFITNYNLYSCQIPCSWIDISLCTKCLGDRGKVKKMIIFTLNFHGISKCLDCGAKYKIYFFPLEYIYFFAWKDNHIEPNFLIFNASDICGCKNIKFPYEFFWKHFKSRPNPMHNVKLLPSFLVMLWKCIFWSLWFFLLLILQLNLILQLYEDDMCLCILDRNPLSHG